VVLFLCLLVFRLFMRLLSVVADALPLVRLVRAVAVVSRGVGHLLSVLPLWVLVALEILAATHAMA
jgi:hypothetical protein